MGNKTEITSREKQPFRTELWPRQSAQKIKDVKLNIKRKPKRTRYAYTADQLAILEKAYSGYKYINLTNRKAMSQALNVNEQCIKNWFQNRRMKEKKEILMNDKNRLNERDSNKVNLSSSIPRYEIKINGLNQKTASTENKNGNDIKTYLPSQFANSTTCANDGESTNNWNHSNQSPVHRPHFQSREVQTNCKSGSNSVNTSLLPKPPCSNLSNASDFIAKEDISELLTDLSQFIQTDSVCYSSSSNPGQKNYELSNSSITGSLHPSFQNEIRISNSNSYSSSDVIATENVNDLSVNFGQVFQSNTYYDHYHLTSWEEEKGCELGTSSLSAVFDNETERYNVYANSVPNSIICENINESRVKLSQENQSDLVYCNPYEYEVQQSYAHNSYDNHYTYSNHSYP
ncbi:homeotic protein proboscipedia-like [Spodoptera litura]|uniref:Homeotic protein proboscipedia-like n=1 Tax=Spodoptera litura TaxID=69820 RepID=A0A9J7IWR9_SPOLT|nr:homeotic protein proboscipedia-like [Spodoptera litura]